MKHKKLVLPFLLALFSFTAVQAQKGLAKLDLNYNVAMPTGSFKDQINNTSFNGFRASVLFGVNDRLSLGLGTGFQDFYQKNERRQYKLNDGSDISAVLTHSIQTIPILAQAKYAFSTDGAIRPYAALGVGGNLISYSELLGEFGGQQVKFGFAARPEAGIYVPFKKGGESGFSLGASYNIMPFKELVGFENLNSLGIHAGISVPLRK